jgi:hypothetical protein
VSLVREELGPSLPQLVAPHWQGLSRARRAAVTVVLAGLVLVLVAAYLVATSGSLKTEVIRGDGVAFNLVHRGDFDPVTPRAGELLRLEGTLPGASGARETFVVRPLTVPAYRGDISSAYPLLATRRFAELKAADKQVAYRGEGRARLKETTLGYQLTYQTRRGGRLVYGKVFFIAPPPAGDGEQSRAGLELALTAERSGQTPTAAAVGADVLLNSPLRSLRFGTERP